MTNKQTITDDLVANQEYYKNVLKHVKIQKDDAVIENPKEYSDEIRDQYKKACSFIIAGILSGKYGIAVDECLEVLEDFDLEVYLDV